METISSICSVLVDIVVMLARATVYVVTFVASLCSSFTQETGERANKQYSEQSCKYSQPLNNTAAHMELINLTNQKGNVDISHLHRAMDEAGLAAVKAYKVVLGESYKPTITSGNDGHEHSRHSKHYKDAALDFRLNDISSRQDKRNIYNILKANLGYNYYILHEDQGKKNEHIHIQMK